MKPDCAYYQDCGRPDGGCCTHPKPPKKSRKPSYGTCNDCGENKAKGRPIVALTINELTVEQAAEAKRNRDKITHGIWQRWHAAALKGQLTDVMVDASLKELPCGTCGPDFAPLRASEPIPPDAAGQLALTVGWHNAVNAKLGKPLVTVDEARQIHSGG